MLLFLFVLEVYTKGIAFDHVKIMEKNNFLKTSNEILAEVFDSLLKVPTYVLNNLPDQRTALVIVDMVNGFAKEGALKSDRIEGLIPEIAALSKECSKRGILKIAFADCHTEASPEFGAYPVHCITGTTEAEIVDEIRDVGGYTLIPKNSTNGFIEEPFQTWLKENLQIDTFIITGNCTDICIQQFAITLKTWFNRHNKKAQIIIPINSVETYDLGTHNGDLMNVMALYNMMQNGIEIVKEIKY